MRLVRVPYFYLPHVHVGALYLRSYRLLRIICDIHHTRPNEEWYLPDVKVFMYYPSFLRWVFAKARSELAFRGRNVQVILSDEIESLKSYPLIHFVPPEEQELAEDVVWLLNKWRHRFLPGGRKLPLSYVELAQRYYGYSPQKAAFERIEDVPGRHRDADRGWYFN